MNHTRNLLSVGVITALFASDIMAQATLEEVVVTARKRSETLAESPISVRPLLKAKSAPPAFKHHRTLST